MFLTKLKTAALVLLACLMFTGTSFLMRQARAEKPPQVQAKAGSKAATGRTHLEVVISQRFTATRGRKTAHFRYVCRRNPLFFSHFEMRSPCSLPSR